MTTVDEAREALPVGAIVASALMAAKYPGDSGEDVDRFLAELRQRGYVVVRAGDPEAEAECAIVALNDGGYVLTRREPLDVERVRLAVIALDHIEPSDAWLRDFAAEYARLEAAE